MGRNSEGLALYDPTIGQDPPKTIIREENNLKETAPGGEAHIIYSGMDRWNYTKPERLLYSHRIDDGPWSPFSSETIATFSDLAAGEHLFEIRAIDRNWNIERNPSSYIFRTYPYWYQDPAFLLILTVGITLIFVLLVYTSIITLP